MKALDPMSASKPPVPDKKPTSGKGMSTTTVNNALKLGTAVIQTTKSIMDYKGHQQKTVQVYIESAAKRENGRQSLQVAELRHVQTMRRLEVDEHELRDGHVGIIRSHDHKDRELELQSKHRDEVMAMLRDGLITPEQAIGLMNGTS